jgi:hypothetical protein
MIRVFSFTLPPLVVVHSVSRASPTEGMINVLTDAVIALF